MTIQEKQNLSIELNGARIPDGMCLAALSFRGGTACSHFAILDKEATSSDDAWDGEEEEAARAFDANRAFWHVFKACVAKLDASFASVDVFLDASATMLVWGFDDPASTAAAIDKLFKLAPNEDMFAEAKEEAFAEYAVKFSNPLFRFTHKILEQTEAAFGFSYEAFTQDFENIDFEEFRTAWQQLVAPGNALLCMMAGDVDQAQAAIDGIELPGEAVRAVAMPMEPVVPFDRHMNIAVLGSSLFELGALCFGFMPDFSPVEKKAYLEVVNQRLFKGAGSVSVDMFDASIMFTERVQDDLLNPQAWQLDEETFARCTEGVAARMADVSQRYPGLFVAEQARDLQQGINDVIVMQSVQRIPYELFAEKLVKAFEQARQIRMAQVCSAEEALHG